MNAAVTMFASPETPQHLRGDGSGELLFMLKVKCG